MVGGLHYILLIASLMAWAQQKAAWEKPLSPLDHARLLGFQQIVMYFATTAWHQATMVTWLHGFLLRVCPCSTVPDILQSLVEGVAVAL